MFYQNGSEDSESSAMSIDQILAGVTDVANRAYKDAAPADRLAFECGMLSSKLRKMAYLLENAQDRIKELEIELAYKDKK